MHKLRTTRRKKRNPFFSTPASQRKLRLTPLATYNPLTIIAIAFIPQRQRVNRWWSTFQLQQVRTRSTHGSSFHSYTTCTFNRFITLLSKLDIEGLKFACRVLFCCSYKLQRDIVCIRSMARARNTSLQNRCWVCWHEGEDCPCYLTLSLW